MSPKLGGQGHTCNPNRIKAEWSSALSSARSACPAPAPAPAPPCPVGCYLLLLPRPSRPAPVRARLLGGCILAGAAEPRRVGRHTSGRPAAPEEGGNHVRGRTHAPVDVWLPGGCWRFASGSRTRGPPSPIPRPGSRPLSLPFYHAPTRARVKAGVGNHFGLEE